MFAITASSYSPQMAQQFILTGNLIFIQILSPLRLNQHIRKANREGRSRTGRRRNYWSAGVGDLLSSGYLFVGQWAAPFPIIGVDKKLVKQHGSDAYSNPA